MINATRVARKVAGREVFRVSLKIAKNLLNFAETHVVLIFSKMADFKQF